MFSTLFKRALGACLPLAALCCATPAARCADDPVVATINGTGVKLSEFHAALEKRAGSQVLTDLLMRQMLLGQAAKDNCLPTPAEIDAEWVKLRTERFGGDDAKLRAALKQNNLDEPGLREEMKMHLAQTKLCTKGVAQDDVTIHKFFNARHAELFDKPLRLSFRQLNVPTREAAAAALASLKAGKTFDEVAGAAAGPAGPGGPPSRNPLVAEMPVDQLKKMAAPLAEVLLKLKPNQVSPGPISFNDGWWVVQLVAQHAVEPASYTDPAVRTAAKAKYLSLNTKQPQALMTELLHAAKVNVADPRYKTDIEARFGPKASLPTGPGQED